MPERRTRDVEHHPLERATDKSKLAVVNAKLGEYRTIIWTIVGVLLALGFKYQTPSARIGIVEKDVQSVRDSISVVKDSLLALKAGQRKTHDALEVLVRLRCFDSTVSNSEKLLAGLDCSDIDRARRSIRDDSVKRGGF